MSCQFPQVLLQDRQGVQQSTLRQVKQEARTFTRESVVGEVVGDDNVQVVVMMLIESKSKNSACTPNNIFRRFGPHVVPDLGQAR